MRESVKSGIVTGVSTVAALAVTAGIPFGIARSLDDSSPSPEAPAPLYETSCGIEESIVDGYLDNLARTGVSEVSMRADGSVQFGRTPDQADFSRDTLSHFEFLNGQAESEAYQTNNIPELRELLREYLAPLGWRVNFGPNAIYPRTIEIDPEHAEVVSIRDDAYDLDFMQNSVATFIGVTKFLPVELLHLAEIRSVNFFRAWSALGRAHHGRHGTDLSFRMDLSRNTTGHEIGHAFDFALCDTDDFSVDEAYQVLNPANFVYHDPREGEGFSPNVFARRDAKQSVHEDRASIWANLLVRGIDPSDNSEVPGLNGVQRKERLLVSRIEAQLPNATSLLVALNMNERATFLQAVS